MTIEMKNYLLFLENLTLTRSPLHENDSELSWYRATGQLDKIEEIEKYGRTVPSFMDFIDKEKSAF